MNIQRRHNTVPFLVSCHIWWHRLANAFLQPWPGWKHGCL